MYLLLVLFFASLLSISFMIWRKLVLLNNGQIVIEKAVSFEFPYMKEIKLFTIQKTKKYGRASLITILRLHIRSANFLKNKYTKIKIRIKEISKKGNRNESRETRESNKFLKMVSEYKQKIREIKSRIEEEENS